MAIIVNETTLGLWYLDVPAGNIVGGLNKVREGTYLFVNRLRVYLDDKAHDSADKRFWDAHTFESESDEAAIKKCQEFFALCKTFPGAGELTEELRGDGTQEDLMNRWQVKPFAKTHGTNTPRDTDKTLQ